MRVSSANKRRVYIAPSRRFHASYADDADTPKRGGPHFYVRARISRRSGVSARLEDARVPVQLPEQPYGGGGECRGCNPRAGARGIYVTNGRLRGRGTDGAGALFDRACIHYAAT